MLNMKKVFLFVAVLLSLILAGSGQGAVINVPGDMDLQDALNTTEDNNEDDTINIAAGIYNTSGTTFSYTPAVGENYSLTIGGAGARSAILDGGNSEQEMYIRTAGLADDSNCHITVTGITFQNGNKTSGNEAGGGLYVITNQANITVEDCEFSGNFANLDGGGLYVRTSQANITVEDCEFSGNTVGFLGGDGGGGVYGRSSTGNMIFTNNIFNGNTAQNAGGGAVSRSQGTITFTNNTSSGNTVNNGDGGGFHITLDLNSTTGNIYNNIVWNNTASGSGDDICVNDAGATINLYNNDYSDFYIQDGGNLSQLDNMNSDPLFVDVSDPDPSNWDLHITASSPCKDAGTASAPSLPATDFDGESRTSASAPDIGADEVPATSSTTPDGGSDGGLCFIATAAYGSRMANDVKVLEKVRDEYLLTNHFGKSLVSFYYKHSPKLANFISRDPLLKSIVRVGLYPLVQASRLVIETDKEKR